MSERAKTIDPQRGLFFKDGYAELFVAWQNNKPAGTIVCAEDTSSARAKGFAECLVGFFECMDDYVVVPVSRKSVGTMPAG